ncbi:hypothetical protein HZC35_02005 [Candidatus Saganbacteria bacterium]|nr:hypothetical protein [Candidatus Saganbacteria bacterium]
MAESPLKARLSEKLGIARMEIDLLGRRVSSQDISQQYRLEDVFESVRTSLNSVQKDLLETMRSTLGPQIPELVPETLEESPREAMNDQILMVEPPKPVPLMVTPAGAGETAYQKWHGTLDVRQIQALEFLRGFERGELWEKIRANGIIMHESAKHSDRPINLVLTATADLMECRVKGLPKLLSGLAENCGISEEAGVAEAWGGIHEVIRLSKLAKAKSTAGPLTEVSKVINEIRFYREEYQGGRFTSKASQERAEDIEADGYRGQSRTVVEIKSSEVPIRFNNRNGHAVDWELRFRNQARKLRAAVRSGRIGGVEYHITAPEVDRELLFYLKKTIRDKDEVVRVRVFFYSLLNEWEGLEQVVLGLDEPPSHIAEECGPEAPPAKANHREWNEGAWVWALAKYTGEGGKFKDFTGEPYNVHKAVRQPQTKAVIDGLQASLNEAIEKARQKKTHARNANERSQADEIITRTQALKRRVAEWRKKLDTNSLSIKVVCDFSLVLAEIREFLGN